MPIDRPTADDQHTREQLEPRHPPSVKPHMRISHRSHTKRDHIADQHSKQQPEQGSNRCRCDHRACWKIAAACRAVRRRGAHPRDQPLATSCFHRRHSHPPTPPTPNTSRYGRTPDSRMPPYRCIGRKSTIHNRYASSTRRPDPHNAAERPLCRSSNISRAPCRVAAPSRKQQPDPPPRALSTRHPSHPAAAGRVPAPAPMRVSPHRRVNSPLVAKLASEARS
jgi:hypothetical protein